MSLVEIYPAAHDVVVVNIPAGTALRIHHPAGARDYIAAPSDTRLVAAIPGDRDHLGWGAGIVRYGSAHMIRNGHHKRDRPLWHEAHRAVREGGTALIQHVRRDVHGRPRWDAVKVHSQVRH
ncbi:hypothetical protein [Actinomadura sp. 3N407]|uniref:hypothetical protein n=1 Tax=Actinomadura sp. 3N407 TaxID=3457423 RepID=UPI003FCC27A0